MDSKYHLPQIFPQIRSVLEAGLGEPDAIKYSELKAHLFSNALLLNTEHRLMNSFTHSVIMCISTVQNFNNQTAVFISFLYTVIFPVQLCRTELLC